MSAFDYAAPSQPARECHCSCNQYCGCVCHEFARQQTAAFELKGWQNAINSVRSSLQQYPNAGGDIEIMQAVEKIVNEKTAAKEAEIVWLRKERHRHVEALEAVQRERDNLAGELRTIDALLARRPALADCTTRYVKITKALAFASRTDKAERELAARKAGKEQ